MHQCTTLSECSDTIFRFEEYRRYGSPGKVRLPSNSSQNFSFLASVSERLRTLVERHVHAHSSHAMYSFEKCVPLPPPSMQSLLGQPVLDAVLLLPPMLIGTRSVTAVVRNALKSTGNRTNEVWLCMSSLLGSSLQFCKRRWTFNTYLHCKKTKAFADILYIAH